ncbi:MAG TPA: NEW3 domain-containing protein, partial [Balneolaceae bacterium]|nr:NEW3 domain-containing protein [Balneolaceae bacterium]
NWLMKTKFTVFSLLLLIFSSCFLPTQLHATPGRHGIVLYTPYISRSVTPGQNVNYNIQVINQANTIQSVTFSYRGIPHSWKPTISAHSNTIQKIAIKPKNLSKQNSKDVKLNLNIPLKIKKGYYDIKVVAKTDNNDTYVLPLRVEVTKEGTFTTKMNVQQANMQGYASSDFNYHFTLSNQTAKKQNYALNADAPAGWSARFRVSGNYATSVSVASNNSKTIYVKVKPPSQVKAGTYNIPIQAISGNTSAQDTLQTVIKGKFNMNLTTPSGRLSTKVTAGSKKTIKLRLKNTGSLPLRHIKLSSSAPDGWHVSFPNKHISELKPGISTAVNATIKASKKAIAGDYQLKINANTKNASSNATFRVTVSKSMVWGSVGIGIIIVVIGGIFMLVRTYGRR